jgi:RNase P subunit RPR2
MSECIRNERDSVIAALSYPRLLMEREVKTQSCGQHYRFNEQADDCVDCLYALECQSNSDRLADENLRDATLSELNKLLVFGYEYVNYELARIDHETEQCSCESCGWIRRVTPLLSSS